MSLLHEPADWHAQRIGIDDTTRTRTEGLPSDEPTLPGGDGHGSTDGLPKTIDRFRVIRHIGSGGMGSVFEGHDPQPDRKVAIKLLGARAEPEDPESKRLLREARALAQLNHPNVVEVFGAGIDDGRVWLAMELVEGQTLKEWAASNPPGSLTQRDEAIALLRQAADGLAAAHALSMTHRDFKPSNVLIGDDGRVRVVDFGLAVHGGVREADVQESVADGPPPRRLEDLITRTGKVVGTPRYMAPEQHLGEPASPRTDQFAFAVTAWELLHGCPPFDTTNPAELYGAIIHRRFRDHREPNVPRRVSRALRRAMSPTVFWRFRSLGGLMAAIDGTRRRRWIAVGVVGAGAVALLGLRPDPTPRNVGDMTERCEREARERIGQVWTAEQRTAIDQALQQSGVPYAVDAKASLERAVERWSREWISTATAHCQTEHVVGPCLQSDLGVLDGVLATMTELTASEAERLTRPVDSLPRPSRCRAGAGGDALEPVLEQRLTHAQVAVATGDYEAAARIAEEVLDADRGLPWHMRIDALAALGSALSRQDDARCTEVYEEAYDIAVAHDAAALATEMAWKSAVAHASHETPEAADFWARRHAAQAARGSHGTDFPADELRCRILESRLEYLSATEACEAALAAVDAGETSPLRRPGILRKLGRLYPHVGKAELGLKITERALAEALRDLGPHHPRTGGMLLNLSVAYSAAGDPKTAIDRAQKASKVFERVYGPHSRWVISATMNEASGWESLGELEKTSTLLESVLPALGSVSALQRARVLNNLGVVRTSQGRFAEALEFIAKVDVIETAELRPGDPQRAFTRMAKGWTYCAQGRWEAALAEMNTAIDIRERTGELGHLSGSLHGRAFVYRRLGKSELALADIHRSLKYVEAGTFPQDVAPSALLRAAVVMLDLERLDDAEGFLGRCKDEFEQELTGFSREAAVHAFLRVRLASARGGDQAVILRDAEDAYERMSRNPFIGFPLEEARAWIDGIR